MYIATVEKYYSLSNPNSIPTYIVWLAWTLLRSITNDCIITISTIGTIVIIDTGQILKSASAYAYTAPMATPICCKVWRILRADEWTSMGGLPAGTDVWARAACRCYGQRVGRRRGPDKCSGGVGRWTLGGRTGARRADGRLWLRLGGA